MLTGDKIKKYLIVTCKHCGESFRVDWADILNSPVDVKFICPWCEGELNSSDYILNDPRYQFVKVE